MSEEHSMFSFHWPHRLQFLHVLMRRPLRHTRPVPLRDDIGALQEDDDNDRPLGCGWFDSSHDLQHGLQVQEADGPALAQLPLAEWLALHGVSGHGADTSLDEAAGMMVDPTLH
jgi:hypothetical protein